MKSLVAVSLSLLYMFVLALFLAFVAIFVCDGYYPVGWNLKGSALHVAFWAMPLSVLIGSLAASLAFRPALALALLLLGNGPFIAAICWIDLSSTSAQMQSPWVHLRVLAGVLAIVADVILIRAAYREIRGSPQIATS